MTSGPWIDAPSLYGEGHVSGEGRIIFHDREGSVYTFAYFLGMGICQEISDIRFDGRTAAELGLAVTIHFGGERAPDRRLLQRDGQDWTGRVYLVIEWNSANPAQAQVNPFALSYFFKRLALPLPVEPVRADLDGEGDVGRPGRLR